VRMSAFGLKAALVHLSRHVAEVPGADIRFRSDSTDTERCSCPFTARLVRQGATQ